MPSDALPAGVHVTYSRQFRRCNKPDCPSCRPGAPGHGPYWYAYWRENGRLRTRYLGRQAPPGASTGAVQPTPSTQAGAEQPPLLPHVDAEQLRPAPQADAIPSASPPLRVRTLGGFEVWRGAEPLPAAAWAQRKVAALFKYLLSAPDHRVPRDAALEMLWPDEDPEVSARNLRQTLHRLRRVLGDGAYVRSEGDMLALIPAPDTAPAPDWLDAPAFDRAARAALAGREATLCRAALAQYGGVYLPDDIYEDWAMARRETLQEQYLALLLHLAALRERDGARVDAVRCLRAVLAVDPCHEPAARALMRVQAADGHHAEAMRTYRHLAEVLRRDLALAPDATTQAQYQALLAAQAAATAQRTNLSTPLTSFLGRSADLATLTSILGRTPPTEGSDAGRLLTLTGAGGCGKTRLAIELGRTLLDAYADGVWIVELATLAETALIVPEVARVLEVREQPQQALLDALTTHLKARHLLLILDNCEHLLDGCALLATALLSACPALSIVATSREALGVLGETVWRVPSLAAPDPARLPPLDELRDCAAVRLFVERARAVQPAFALTARNVGAVAGICHQLDGIPLALELAAARLVTLPVEAVAARLSDRFRLLAGGNRAALPRHQTLRAVLDWSYALLDQPERLLLQRLSVFAGGWSLEAAEAVCSGGEITTPVVADLLDRLVRKSLVQVEDGGAEIEQPRYRLLETVRQYARERAATEDERRTLHDAHLAWCLSLAERAEAAWHGSAQPAWLFRLAVEHDNLRAALSWSAGEGHQVETGLRLATALAPFWDQRGYVAEGRAWLGLFLERYAACDDAARRRRCAALNRASILAWRQGDLAAALALMEDSLALARQLNDRGLLADAIGDLGVIVKERGEYERATALFEEAMALDQQRDNHRGVVSALSNLVWVAHAREDYAAAAALAEDCLARCRALGDTYIGAYVLGHLAAAAYALGDMDRAWTLYHQTLRAALDLGVRWGIAICLEGLARVVARQGRPEQAVLWWGAAAALRDDIDVPLSAQDRVVYDYDRSVAAAQEQLGDVRFAAVWAAGQAAGVEQAIAEALGTVQLL